MPNQLDDDNSALAPPLDPSNPLAGWLGKNLLSAASQPIWDLGRFITGEGGRADAAANLAMAIPGMSVGPAGKGVSELIPGATQFMAKFLKEMGVPTGHVQEYFKQMPGETVVSNAQHYGWKPDTVSESSLDQIAGDAVNQYALTAENYKKKWGAKSPAQPTPVQTPAPESASGAFSQHFLEPKDRWDTNTIAGSAKEFLAQRAKGNGNSEHYIQNFIGQGDSLWAMNEARSQGWRPPRELPAEFVAGQEPGGYGEGDLPPIPERGLKQGYTERGFMGRDTESRRESESKWYASSDPRIANMYAHHIDDIDDPMLREGSNISPMAFDTSNYDVIDGRGRNMKQLYTDAMANAKADGKSGVVFKNTYDEPNFTESGKPTTIYVSIDPHTRKSIFAKDFDPTSKDVMKNIVMGLGVAGAGGYAMLSDRAEAKPGDVPSLMRMYHASPHNFDAFSLSHLGKGEGGRDFGAGTYAAEAPGVMEKYYRDFVKDRGQAVRYALDVKGHPDEFLHFDKPFEEQSAQVQDALRKVGITNLDERRATALQRIGRGAEYLTPEESQALGEAGVKGVRYLDRYSRQAGHGTHNVVVFDPKNIDIIKKYGIAGLIAGGAAGAAMGRDRAEAAQQPQFRAATMAPVQVRGTDGRMRKLTPVLHNPFAAEESVQ